MVFCPHCLHSGSVNFGSVPRYVVVQSFQHCRDAELLRESLASRFYLKGFHENTHAALATIAPELSPMLRGKHLWGEAMAEQLRAFKKDGYFLHQCVAISLNFQHVATQSRCELDSQIEWMSLRR